VVVVMMMMMMKKMTMMMMVMKSLKNKYTMCSTRPDCTRGDRVWGRHMMCPEHPAVVRRGPGGSLTYDLELRCRPTAVTYAHAVRGSAG
jgi:hypothetical protein